MRLLRRHDVLRPGNDLTVGELIETVGSRPYLVEELPNPGEILFTANDFYGRPAGWSVPAVQLTWDDDSGRFPWDDGYAHPAWRQPRPGTFRA